MSVATVRRTSSPEFALRTGRLPRTAALGAAALAVSVTAVLFLITPVAGVAEFVLVSAVLAVVAVTSLAWYVEGGRRARSRLAAMSAWAALVVALAPLVAVLANTVAKGAARFGPNFLTHSMAGVGPISHAGGVYHAIVGTVEQVALASLLAVPLGLLVAIYLQEYRESSLALPVRFLVDVMTGIPSIVAGLFVFAFWVIGLHRGFSGFAGSIALAVLMLPIVVRTAEEMLALVPHALREAALALGVPRWRTVLSVVLPTAAGGITTGVLLAVARVTGETAPLLLTVGGSAYIQNNPFSGQQDSVPLFVFQQSSSAYQVAIDRAWAGALTLIVLVGVLYLSARLLTRYLGAPSR